MKTFIAQGIGMIGTVLIILSFQCKSTRKLFLMQVYSNLLYIAHFFLLGAYNGCATMVLHLVRNVTFSSKGTWAKWKGWPAVLVALQVVVTAVTWSGIFSVLLCVGTTTIILSGWSRNAKNVRVANFFVNSPAWLLYDIYTHSISGIICEVFCEVSVVVSILRYGWKALDVKEE